MAFAIRLTCKELGLSELCRLMICSITELMSQKIDTNQDPLSNRSSEKWGGELDRFGFNVSGQPFSGYRKY